MDRCSLRDLLHPHHSMPRAPREHSLNDMTSCNDTLHFDMFRP